MLVGKRERCQKKIKKTDFLEACANIGTLPGVGFMVT